MNILVVGGAGYVGGVTTDVLMESGATTRVYDCLLYEEEYRKPVDFVYGDVRDTDLLGKHLDWADAVVWLAALVGDSACALNPDVSISINQEAVRWLAENYDGRIVFLSTCSVYGAQDDVLDEDAPTNPLSVYAVSKLEAEGHLAGKNALIFRLGTLFGVGDEFSRIRLDLVVNTLTVRAYQHGRIKVYGGEQYRPLLHVRDVAAAIAVSLPGQATGVFNLHRENVRIIDLAQRMRRYFPNLTIERAERRFEDPRNYRVSSEKAARILSLSAKLGVGQGIEELKEILESGRLKDLDNPRYTNQGFLARNKTHLGG